MKIKEIFLSLQGEGLLTGKPFIFVRFAGCNLQCPFCDTDFSGGDDYTENELVDAISKFECKSVLFTGGEPTLQLKDSLITKLVKRGFYIAIETNGTKQISELINYVTVSPKEEYSGKVLEDNKIIADEVRYTIKYGDWLPEYNEYWCGHQYLSPIFDGDKMNKKNLQWVQELLKKDYRFSLSIQLHKILGIK